MNTIQSNLVIVGANTPECKVFWNGKEVQHAGISIDNNSTRRRVILSVQEDPVLAEMQAAGVIVRRG